MGERRGCSVGTGYPETFGEQDLCQAAHADAADTNEIYMNGIVKINLIHGCLLEKFTFFTSIILIWQKKTNMFLEKVSGNVSGSRPAAYILKKL